VQSWRCNQPIQPRVLDRAVVGGQIRYRKGAYHNSISLLQM